MSHQSNRLIKIFEDADLVGRIRNRLPYLFELAELESSRAGKVGMEVGSLRERIIIALLIYKFGQENVETNIPITQPEVDAKVFNTPISIKTITGEGGVKAVWTVDAIKAKEFLQNYVPRVEMLLVRVNWGGTGKFFYIPGSVQQEVFNSLGRYRYFKLPKAGTNPRGVEFSKETITALVRHKNTKSIDIFWLRSKVDYNAYQRWVDYWSKD